MIKTFRTQISEYLFTEPGKVPSIKVDLSRKIQ